MIAVGQREELLAQARATLGKAEIAHAADLVGAVPLLDAARHNSRMPALMAVEVAQHRPELLYLPILASALGRVKHSCCQVEAAAGAMREHLRVVEDNIVAAA